MGELLREYPIVIAALVVFTVTTIYLLAKITELHRVERKRKRKSSLYDFKTQEIVIENRNITSEVSILAKQVFKFETSSVLELCHSYVEGGISSISDRHLNLHEPIVCSQDLLVQFLLTKGLYISVKPNFNSDHKSINWTCYYSVLKPSRQYKRAFLRIKLSKGSDREDVLEMGLLKLLERFRASKKLVESETIRL